MESALGTLASLTALLFATKIDSSRLQGVRNLKVNYDIEWQGKTVGVVEGPIMVGMCGQVTIAEIASWHAADPQSSHDDLPHARSTQPIIVLGYIGQPAQSGPGTSDYPAVMRSKKFPWDVIEGEAFSFFAFNMNPADPLTTGMTLQIPFEILGEWRED